MEKVSGIHIGNNVRITIVVLIGFLMPSDVHQRAFSLFQKTKNVYLCSMRSALNILSVYSLRNTSSRKDILDVFLKEGKALSQKDIEDQMTGECDRVTIYRTLSTFLDKGVIHRVLDDTGAMKYALCDPNCDHQEIHNHDHVHFKCNNCGMIKCINEAEFPPFSLPSGYKMEEVNVLVQGTCPTCNEKA